MEAALDEEKLLRFSTVPKVKTGGGDDEPAHENVPQPIGNWWWQIGGM